MAALRHTSTPDIAVAVAGAVVLAAGIGRQNAVVFKVSPRHAPQAIGGTSG